MDWNLDPIWIPLTEINGGEQYEGGDGVKAVDLTAIVQNLQVLYNTHTEGDYIDVGMVSVTTVDFTQPAAVSISTRRDPEDSRVLLDFTFSIPRGYPALTYGQYYYSNTAPQAGSSITQPTTKYNRTAAIGDQLLFVYVHTSGSTETAYMCSATVTNVTLEQVTMQISNLVQTTQTGVVYYDKQQELTEDQKEQARQNIGADSTFRAYVNTVGAVLFSFNDDFSPSALFGGSWEKITDRFIVGAGGSYALDSTGGEANVTLTTNEIPPHDHVVNVYNIEMDAPSGEFVIPPAKVDAKNTLEGYPTQNAGGGQPHNNMPPYIAVNIWRRVA